MRIGSSTTTIAAALLLALLAAPAGLWAQAAPSGLSAIGGTVFASGRGNPQAGIGYPLAEWASIFGRGHAGWGHGTVEGIVTTTDVGIGLGHRFEDFLSGQGQRVSFTIGPAYTVRWKATRAGSGGLRGGTLGIFATVALRAPNPALAPAAPPAEK
jgi:hypothetical protein